MRFKLQAAIAAALLFALTCQANAQQAGVRATRDIAYAHPGGVAVNLDLYMPEHPAGKLPVVIYIHGGAWRAGDKSGCPTVGMVALGYAVISANYRLVPSAKWPAQIYDCKAVIRWVRAHAAEYGFNGDRIGVIGDSAGGHLVALLGTTAGVKALEGDEGNARFSSRVEAVVDMYGPTDFPGFLADNTAPDKAGVRQVAVEFLGESAATAKAASPLTYVSAKAAPFLILHGDRDTLVPISQSKRFCAALQKAGATASLTVMTGKGHEMPGEPYVSQIIAFFNKYLKK